MAKKNEQKGSGKTAVPGIGEKSLKTAIAAEVLYRRLNPFLEDLYRDCGGLMTKGTYTEGQFNVLVQKHGLTDLTVTPETLLNLVTLEAKEVIDASNLQGQARTDFLNGVKLEDKDLNMAPWLVVMTQWHLLSMTGHPPNEAFQRLYATQQPSH